jgi:hypothetical protein
MYKHVEARIRGSFNGTESGTEFLVPWQVFWGWSNYAGVAEAWSCDESNDHGIGERKRKFTAVCNKNKDGREAAL